MTKQLSVGDFIALKRKTDDTRKPKCPGCGERARLQFSVNGARMQATCGAARPCGFRAEATRTQVVNIRHELERAKGALRRHRREIISAKLDYVHGLATQDETLARFETLTRFMNESAAVVSAAEAEFGAKVAQPERHDEIKRKAAELQEAIASLHNTRGEPGAAVRRIVDVITPLAEELTALQYEFMTVVEDAGDDACPGAKLIQDTIALSSLYGPRPTAAAAK